MNATWQQAPIIHDLRACPRCGRGHRTAKAFMWCAYRARVHHAPAAPAWAVMSCSAFAPLLWHGPTSQTRHAALFESEAVARAAIWVAAGDAAGAGVQGYTVSLSLIRFVRVEGGVAA